MDAIVAGIEDGLCTALEDGGVQVRQVEGDPTGEALQTAGVDDADLLVLGDAGLATAIPVALERNPSLRTVIYATDSAPEFVRGQLDLSVDPRLVDHESLVAALVDDTA